MKIGDVVISTYGRDMGEWYIVKETENKYVFLINGQTKPISKPKKKKCKHILKTSFYAKEVAQKIALNRYLQDAEVRKTLKFFKEQN